MYCANCGSPINEELNYCNRCGKRVAGNELATRGDGSVSVLKSLSIATGFVGVFGVGGLIAIIIKLIESGIQSPAVVFLVFFFAATVFGICFLLTRQISRLTETSVSTKRNLKEKLAPEQLNSNAAAQIESPREPFLSVTENTTRTLNKTKI
ncbi:MAG: hypothetical protein M3033_15955 [Acidobacteriota bacterium]|nr:hypothetical protein [Acidobacteriota bacterium]